MSEVRVTSPGMYFLWFIICDKTLSGVSVTGSTVWKNPGGYLPGMMTPYLTFYGALWLVGGVWYL